MGNRNFFFVSRSWRDEKTSLVISLIRSQTKLVGTLHQSNVYEVLRPSPPLNVAWLPMFLCHLAEPTHSYSCKMTKSRLHTPISTVVHAEVVCTPKFLPISIFLSHTLRSKITAPWNMSQHQNSLRISLETSVSYPYFQVRFFLVMLLTSKLDTAAEETWLGFQFSLYREWYGQSKYNTYPILWDTTP